MAGAAVCSATVILLMAMAVFASVSSASDPLTAVQATDRTVTEETSNLLPEHRDRDKEEAAKARGHGGGATNNVASLVSMEDGKKAGPDQATAKKVDDGDDDDDSDHDHNSDHDSDSDHDHDSDHDSDSAHDHDSDSAHDHDSDSDSDSNSNDDDDDYDYDYDDDNHNSKNGSKKKHAGHGRKGAPGGKRDDELPKVVIKV